MLSCLLGALGWPWLQLAVPDPHPFPPRAAQCWGSSLVAAAAFICKQPFEFLSAAGCQEQQGLVMLPCSRHPAAL